MPIRTFLILVGLFIACLAVTLIAWACGSEFYMFLPSRRHIAVRPPTHPVVVLGLLLGCVPLYLYSQRYALLFFSVLLGGFVLGTIVGCAVFGWTPTVAQALIMLGMGVEAVYGWTIQGDYLDD